MIATYRPSLEALIALDPQIDLLLREAAGVRDDRRKAYFCGNEVFYTRFKPRVASLVGWFRRDGRPELSTSVAYDVVFDAVYDKMPACRRCACL
jgi:hypothetical protein